MQHMNEETTYCITIQVEKTLKKGLFKYSTPIFKEMYETSQICTSYEASSSKTKQNITFETKGGWHGRKKTLNF